MIAVEHLSMQFGGSYLFRDVTFTVRPGDRVGIVGPNGAGKSTLLRILTGQYEPEDGSVNIPNDYSLGYLPQEPTLDEKAQRRSLINEALRAKESLQAIEDEMEDLREQMEREADNAHLDSYMDIIDRYGELQHRFEDEGGFTIRSITEKILSGLGFLEKDFDRPVAEFSGGWQMRLLLAKLLIQQPDALLLDEPTNHLDLESLMWLEDFLKAYDGSVLLVSHDRAFLNTVTNRTAEIEHGSIEVFHGNYDKYEQTRAEREALREAQAATLQQRRKEIESFVEKFRYKATKAKQAQSRIKMLARMERVELVSHSSTVHFTFPAAPQSGKMVFEVKNGGKRYDDHQVFDNVDFVIQRGERVAFLGKNGEGKTTMGKILAGVEPITNGEANPGHNVTIGYYAQHQAEALENKMTVLETLESVSRAQFFREGESTGSAKSMAQLRTLLGAFLFKGDDVHKPVHVLSGGEKSRLALAKMLLEPVNTLILDEPTNHLDMRSKEVLREAVLAFDGTVILVSHDRDFLDELPDRILAFQDGVVKEYANTLEQYLDDLHEAEIARIEGKRKADKKAAAPKPAAPKPAAPVEKPKVDNAKSANDKRREAEERNQRSKLGKPLRDRIGKAEKVIEKLESDKQAIEDAMLDADYYLDPQRVKSDAQKHADLKTKLEAAYFEWAKISEELEKVGI